MESLNLAAQKSADIDVCELLWFVQSEGSAVNDATTLLPKCLMLYGDWLAETRSQSPNVILEHYLSKVVSLSVRYY